MADKLKTVVIRDDDTSFFTDPDRLERVYGRLWERDLPVCLAVIPAHNANVHVAHREGNPFDPSIAKGYRGQDHCFEISANPSLCNYLRARFSDGHVEICLHGYSHAYMEFAIDDADQIEQKLLCGGNQLKFAFPEAEITTFIAPYDNLSPSAFTQVVKHNYDISTLPETVAVDPDLIVHGLYQHLVSASGNHIFTCGEYLFNHRDQPEHALRQALQRLDEERFLIITNHYWTFFYDWAQPTDLLRAWHQFLDQLLARDDVRIMTFQSLRQENPAGHQQD